MWEGSAEAHVRGEPALAAVAGGGQFLKETERDSTAARIAAEFRESIFSSGSRPSAGACDQPAPAAVSAAPHAGGAAAADGGVQQAAGLLQTPPAVSRIEMSWSPESGEAGEPSRV